MTWSFLVLFAAGCASGPKAEHPFPGIVYHVETRQQPPMRLFIAEVDLTNPHVHVRVIPGGPDPDGPGKWETTLTEPTKIAERERLDLVVNGDFFAPRRDKSVPNAKLTPGMWAMVAGPAVTDGNAWANATNQRPCLVVDKNKKVDIELRDRGTPDDWEVIAGNIVLVKDGVVVPRQSKIVNPRTAVGLAHNGRKLVILVVDGRQPGVSVGMSDADMGKELLRLGCRQAINLDGGGSTVMAMRDPVTDKIRILNHPSDGHERPVADVLGISVDAAPNR